MRIVYLRSARHDLETIHSHMAAGDPSAANRLIDAIRDAVTRLVIFPRRAPEWYAGVRKLSVKGYAIIYRITDDRIEIGRVLHLRRDLDALRIDLWATGDLLP